MQKFNKQISSDGIKLSKTPFFILHLLIPLIGILIFAIYQNFSIYNPEKFTVNFYQVLTLIYPLLAAWICSIVTEQEMEAGGGFFLLSTSSRAKTLLSKLLFLILFGLIACLMVTFGYVFVISLLIPNFYFSIFTTFWMTLTIWACSLFTYVFHTWLGLRFGRNVSFAIGAVEILISTLLLTGLGDGIWFFIPSAWGVRLISLLSSYLILEDTAVMPSLKLGLSMLILLTLLMFVFLFIWIHRWEGRKNEE